MGVAVPEEEACEDVCTCDCSALKPDQWGIETNRLNEEENAEWNLAIDTEYRDTIREGRTPFKDQANQLQ